MNKRQFKAWLAGHDDAVEVVEKIYHNTNRWGVRHVHLPSKKEIKEVFDELVCDRIILGKEENNEGKP